jgi:FlaA1/EpsC-like NDP-sugar epimerase
MSTRDSHKRLGVTSGFGGWLRDKLGSSVREALILAADAVVAVCALWLAYELRFEFSVPRLEQQALPGLLVAIAGCRVAANMALRLHRWSFRLSGLVDAARVGLATLFGTGMFVLVYFLLRLGNLPRSVILIEFLLSGIVMGLVRFSPRLTWQVVHEQVASRRDDANHALILGAGSAGELLLRDLMRSEEAEHSVVGFLDDDPGKWGLVVGGKTVLGGFDTLPEMAKKHHVEQVLIAVPRLPARRIRELLTLCGELKLKFRIIPVSYVYLQEKGAAAMLQELQPEDLLPRDEVHFAGNGERALVKGRRVLVTGAAGSIGREICRQLLEAGVGQLVMVDMNENELYLLARSFERRFPDVGLLLEVADIRDRSRMEWLFARFQPQDVFHAAAHKHVPLMETGPGEAVKNNILGTRNVAEAADHAGVERFVMISTDKAVRPTSVMGASKRVAEMITRRMARASSTRFCAVRFGNVLGSSGSVVPLFREQIAAGGPVTVTDPEVKRYFMTVSEAVGLVLRAGYADFGDLCVLDMGEQIRIADLARHMITMAGLVPDVDVKIQYSGLRPGEKLYEELMTEQEECTREVADRIFVASCPAPPVDLDERVEELAQAAAAEDGVRVIELLRKLVPSYEPPHDFVGLMNGRGRVVAKGAAPLAADAMPTERSQGSAASDLRGTTRATAD